MIKRSRIFILAAALLPWCGLQAALGAPGPALPGEGGQPRQAVSLEVAPWRALLRVQTRYGTRCTGFLIAPAIAVTAAHCLFGPHTGRLLQPDSVHVLLRYRQGDYAAHARARRLIVAARYDPRHEATQEGMDRALLLLDHAIATAADVLRIAPAVPAPGAVLALAGYGVDRDEVAVRGPPCRLLRITGDGERTVLDHDCAGTSGTSGAPLLTQDADGGWLVIGVQIEARVGAAGGRASGLSARGVAPGPPQRLSL